MSHYRTQNLCCVAEHDAPIVRHFLCDPVQQQSRPVPRRGAVGVGCPLRERNRCDRRPDVAVGPCLLFSVFSATRVLTDVPAVRCHSRHLLWNAAQKRPFPAPGPRPVFLSAPVARPKTFGKGSVRCRWPVCAAHRAPAVVDLETTGLSLSAVLPPEPPVD